MAAMRGKGGVGVTCAEWPEMAKHQLNPDGSP